MWEGRGAPESPGEWSRVTATFLRLHPHRGCDSSHSLHIRREWCGPHRTFFSGRGFCLGLKTIFLLKKTSSTVAICYVPTAVGDPPTAVIYPQPTVGCPPTAVGHPTIAVGYPLPAVGYPPTAVGYPPNAVGYSLPTVSYPPTAVGYPPTAAGTVQPPSNCAPEQRARCRIARDFFSGKLKTVLGPRCATQCHGLVCRGRRPARSGSKGLGMRFRFVPRCTQGYCQSLGRGLALPCVPVLRLVRGALLGLRAHGLCQWPESGAPPALTACCAACPAAWRRVRRARGPVNKVLRREN